MKLTKDDFDLEVVEFESGVHLYTGMEQPEARELAKQILKNQEIANKVKKEYQYRKKSGHLGTHWECTLCDGFEILEKILDREK